MLQYLATNHPSTAHASVPTEGRILCQFVPKWVFGQPSDGHKHRRGRTFGAPPAHARERSALTDFRPQSTKAPDHQKAEPDRRVRRRRSPATTPLLSAPSTGLAAALKVSEIGGRVPLRVALAALRRPAGGVRAA